MTDQAHSTDHLWKLFQADLDLYKFYLELAVKLAVVFFGLAGAILAYSLANYREDKLVAVALLLPSLLGVLLAVMCLRGARGAEILCGDHESIWSDLRMTLPPYDLSFLRDILRGLAWIYGLVAIIILALFLWLSLGGQWPRKSGDTPAPNQVS